MKLTYRGVSYEHKPATLEYTEGEIGGQYRGQDWHYHYPKHIPQLRSKLYRHYRGVNYSTQSTPFAENVAVGESTIIGRACPVSVSKPPKAYVDKITQVHLDNIRRNLERRLQVAKSKGNEELIRMLENEFKQLALKN